MTSNYASLSDLKNSAPTYLLTPWCRVLLDKLTGLQLVKKFPAFHRTRRFITAHTSVRNLSLSWASPIQSIYPHPTSWRSILIFFLYIDLFRHAPLQECNTRCSIVHFGNFFIIGNAVIWTISGFPLHLHLQYFEHLKTGGVQFVKSL